jgi:hypothetical protein
LLVKVSEATLDPLPSPKASCAKNSMFRPVPALTPQQGEHQEVGRGAAWAASVKASARLRCRVSEIKILLTSKELLEQRLVTQSLKTSPASVSKGKFRCVQVHVSRGWGLLYRDPSIGNYYALIKVGAGSLSAASAQTICPLRGASGRTPKRLAQAHACAHRDHSGRKPAVRTATASSCATGVRACTTLPP